MPTISASAATARECDPLLAKPPAAYRASFYPRGFEVSVASNSPAVLQAAELSWAGLERRFDAAPMELRCVVSPDACSAPLVPPVVRAQRHLAVWTAGPNSWCCDLAAGFGTAWIAESLAADVWYLCYHVLEAMAYSLLASLHVVPLHAACVARNGRGVLLAGESGAGKSSLAYACARRGWTYVSDDCSSLLRRGAGRTVVGDPRLFRFRVDAGALFPEFRDLPESPHARGKPTVEALTDIMPGIRTASECSVRHIVFLNRTGAAGAELTPVDAEEAMWRLSESPWPPDMPGEAERRAALERLTAVPAYELRYRSLDDATERLERLVL